jgi:methyl-accepting chemotaxis protein/methyl-accepting chemotaxis protein-1 (serine sensor receptor)
MVAVLGATAYLGISSMGDRFHAVLGSGVKRQVLAYRMDSSAAEMSAASRGELLGGASHDPAAVDRYHRQFADLAAHIASDAAELAGELDRPDAKQAIEASRSALASSIDSEQAIHSAISSGNMAKALSPGGERLAASEAALKPALASVVRMQDEGIAGDIRLADLSIGSNRVICVGALIFCALLGGAIVMLVRDMNRDLIAGVTDLNAAIAQIASSASQVASSSQSIAQGASEQAATIEETSSASAEINSMARRNTENSRSTAEIVTVAQLRTAQTNGSLKEMVEAMDGITASSQKISKIIKVIDEIAFQTNILALNAAVEAARAGDAGKGFAVVADEVRNLAQRSAQAAKDTAELIEESIQRSHGGKTKVDQVAGGIQTMNAETAKIKVLMDEINLGSVEQSRGIDQISRAITEMEQVTQNNAASAEESAAAAEELSSQAQAIRDVVERLSAMVGATMESVTQAPLAGSRAGPAPLRLAARPARSPYPGVKPARGAALAPARAGIPMDDDFKEF